jgi:itaconyl-CoA hydratase
MPTKFWDDFSLGQKVTTPSITVTETHVVNWAGLTMDFYPLHMDKEFASKTVFKERIAHGPLTFALGVGLMYQTGVAEDSVIAWLGADINRIPAPVKLGDTIHVEAEVTELRDTKNPSQGVMIMRYDVINQRRETVMIYDMKFLMHRRVRQVA